MLEAAQEEKIKLLVAKEFQAFNQKMENNIQKIGESLRNELEKSLKKVSEILENLEIRTLIWRKKSLKIKDGLRGSD